MTLTIHDDNSGAPGNERATDAAAITEGGTVHVKVVATGKKDDGSDVAVADLSVSWNCVVDTAMTAKLFTPDKNVTMGAVTGATGEFTGQIDLDDSSNDELAASAAHTCTISASISGVSGSEKTGTVKVTGAAS